MSRRPDDSCYHCGGPYAAYGFVVAFDAEGQPVRGEFCADCRALGRKLHDLALGRAPAATPVAAPAKPFDKPPPQQDGQGRLF